MNALIDVNDIRIETKRLLLRPICQEDFPQFHEICTNPNIAKFEGWQVSATEENSHKRLNEHIATRETLAVVLKETGTMVGTCSIQARDWKSYPIDSALKGRELGVDLMEQYWGRGLIPEAVTAVTEYCFRELGYDFVTGGYFAGNHQSLRVLEKCGYSFLFKDVLSMPFGKDVTVRTHIRYKE